MDEHRSDGRSMMDASSSTSTSQAVSRQSTVRRLLSISSMRQRTTRAGLDEVLRGIDARESAETNVTTQLETNAGRARVELNDGDVYRGPWEDHSPVGVGRYSWANGNEYVGEFRDGVPNGRGTYEWANGGVYRGDFCDGLMHGRGRFVSAGGTEYMGAWRRGKKHGLGAQRFANGDYYEGLWSNGTPHGPGTYKWESREGEEKQDKFNGEWFNGKMNGWGTLQWASGDRYDGNWCENEISGNGILTWSDGSSYSGRWRQGKREGPGALTATDSEDENGRARLAKFTVTRPLARTMSFDASDEDIETLATDLGNTYVLLCECDDDKIVKKEIVEAKKLSERHHAMWMRPIASRSQKVRRVRHGETIYKGHGSYDLMLQLRVGIRWSVSSVQDHVHRPLQPENFAMTLKQVFPRAGSSKTPPHFAREFKWKEYRPEVFRKLRTRWEVDPADFMLSLCGDQALRELSSPGKSGSVFYLSHDDRFIIKTMRKSEMSSLKSWLHQYYKHVHDYPETLLPKFFGLYSIKAAGSGRKVRFVVMANLFCTKHVVHRTFDLKGSTHGRYTKKGGNEAVTVFKDLDISSKFRVEEGKRDKLVKQLEIDCEFLKKLRIMDYSLLVGVHYLPKRQGLSPTAPLSPRRSLAVAESDDSTWGGNEWRESAIQSVRRNLTAIDLYNSRKELGFTHGGESKRPPAGTDDLIAHVSGARQVALGVSMSAVSVYGRVLDAPLPEDLALDDQKEPQDVILNMGIIDILQQYTTSKSLETTMMGVMGKKSFSSVEPTSYAKRFLNFLTKIFE